VLQLEPGHRPPAAPLPAPITARHFSRKAFMKLKSLFACLVAACFLLAPAAASASVSTAPDVTTYSQMQYAYDSLFCLSFEDGHTANGTPLQIFTCNGTDTQKWIRVHVVNEDNGDFYVIQNKKTQKCIQASSSSLRSALVEEPCNFSSFNFNELQLWTRGNGAGACPKIGQTATWADTNLGASESSAFPEGDIWPSGGNVNPAVHMYMNSPPQGQPFSKVCWTLPNEITLS